MAGRRTGRYPTLVASLVATLALGISCDREPRGGRVTFIGVSGHTNEYVSAASDGGMTVALAWAATSETMETNVFAEVSTDGGQTFSAPVRVNTVEGQANVNGERRRESHWSVARMAPCQWSFSGLRKEQTGRRFCSRIPG